MLLGILVFNWLGYQLYISVMEMSENNKLEAQLDDNNYDESELISVKVPATHLSYYTNSKLFERVDGQIEVNGISYKFVKRRLFNDTLELLCIPNHAIMKLQAINDNFFKWVNDLPHNLQGKKENISHISYSNSFSEYYAVNSIMLSYAKRAFTATPVIVNQSPQLSSCFLESPGKPPECC